MFAFHDAGQSKYLVMYLLLRKKKKYRAGPTPGLLKRQPKNEAAEQPHASAAFQTQLIITPKLLHSALPYLSFSNTRPPPPVPRLFSSHRLTILLSQELVLNSNRSNNTKGIRYLPRENAHTPLPHTRDFLSAILSEELGAWPWVVPPFAPDRRREALVTTPFHTYANGMCINSFY
ncbi:hypothetical protein A9K55_005302 [Cordyceps militaris]|uniref:Uncharacterized protein n=1 Tax=Cordyceps militaris TaxID=73501 RepID=A0A2H4SPA6_CORMI|nr:hypothetical protein A9K55_005302 [Cordyceps militaris]